MQNEERTPLPAPRGGERGNTSYIAGPCVVYLTSHGFVRLRHREYATALPDLTRWEMANVVRLLEAGDGGFPGR